MISRRQWITGITSSAALMSRSSSARMFAQESSAVGDGDSRHSGQADHDRRIREIETTEVAKWQKEREALAGVDPDDPKSIDRLSRRGDVRFFLREFEEAVADFEAMERLDPAIAASHWRLGIARYYAGRFEQSAAVFERYHSFDNVDRENGIWRFLAHHRAFGREAARRQLLKYEKDDRPPFREVYRLFDGSLDAAAVLASIPDALPAEARNSRRFYAHLYIGLNHCVEDDNAAARAALQAAVLNDWPRSAGFGPHWMWQVARVQLALLESSP